MTSHRVTGYTVYPTGIDETVLDAADQYVYLLRVEEAGPGSWAVRDAAGMILRVDLIWRLEPRDRGPEFYKQYRFPSVEAALAAAEKVVDYVVRNSATFAEADAWARRQA